MLCAGSVYEVLHVGVARVKITCIGIVTIFLNRGCRPSARQAGLAVALSSWSTLMVFGRNQVGLAIGFVAVGELLGHTVHSLYRIAEFGVMTHREQPTCSFPQ